MTFPSGFVIVDKPSGVTSFSMVSLVRRLTGVRRVGHAGTLDPLATGVLPIAIGQAARFIEYMDDAPKVYLATIRFGATTDTYDAEGTLTSTADASHLSALDVDALLPSFTGDIEQVPPAFSAIKVAGKPLYRYAREAAPVSVAGRRVHISRLMVRHFHAGTAAEAEIEVICGKGTYIRSLAHDLGEQLRVGAHLTALRRLASGGFDVSQAWTPEDLESRANQGRLESALLATDRAVERRPAAIVSSEHAEDMRAGRNIELPALPRHGTVAICRAYDPTGSFLGVLTPAEQDGWHPAKVVADA